jgi:hypothetical protein
MLPQAISILNLQPQRFLHLRKQLHCKLRMVTVAPTFLDDPTLMLDESLAIGDMSLRFHEALRKMSFVAAHDVSCESLRLQQDTCQAQAARDGSARAGAGNDARVIRTLAARKLLLLQQR